MLPNKLTTGLVEIRLDIKGSNQGTLRLGLAVTVATVAVAASGWPPGDVLHRMMFFVLGALPLTGVGVGLIFRELIQTRADRQGRHRADDREVRALRARIAAEAAGTGHLTPLVATPQPTRQREFAAAFASSSPSRTEPRAHGPLVARRRVYAPFRRGFLGLR